MKKKTLTLAATVFMAAMALSACSTGNDTGTGSTAAAQRLETSGDTAEAAEQETEVQSEKIRLMKK